MSLVQGCSRLLVRAHRTLPPLSRTFASDSGLYEPEGIKEPWIPEYRPRADEHMETKRSRLLYQSRKRGMLENGLVLSTFASRYLAGMTGPQLDDYDKLINQPSNDWDIYYWATGVRETPKEFDSEIMKMLKEFVRNKDRESRIAQPDLYEKPE
ncbi:succinate dehydrogenase assembly factor 2, mitochondrial-like [Pollicipes pollicipes]|uniref:succinate dehydrogenase assembly factor 2, mitochondrial-like n=1 Tax=Pollicipes pollicipes TaxID=41117 RepID=UPI0018853769|nr:succinate dehydrogenase assembly factor 2, mitochondrial-like [Pollicipes pollicipes]